MASLIAALSPIGWLTLAIQGHNAAEMAMDGDPVGLISAMTGLVGLLFDAMMAAAEKW